MNGSRLAEAFFHVYGDFSAFIPIIFGVSSWIDSVSGKEGVLRWRGSEGQMGWVRWKPTPTSQAGKLERGVMIGGNCGGVDAKVQSLSSYLEAIGVSRAEENFS